MLGVAGANYHFEFTHSRKHRWRPHLRSKTWRFSTHRLNQSGKPTCAGMLAAGFTQVTAFNPYWEVRGRTYEDRDGYRIACSKRKGATSLKQILCRR